jgi:hypothetical protein
MTPSSPSSSGGFGTGRGGNKNNITNYFNKSSASTNVDPDEVVAKIINAPVDFVRELRNEIEDVFEDHATGLIHLAAFVLNYIDKPPYNELIKWVKQNHQRILNIHVPKYLMKKLQAMSTSGCNLLWDNSHVALSEGECLEVFHLITIVLYVMVRTYDEHGVWHVIGGGSEEGDMYITLRG